MATPQDHFQASRRYQEYFDSALRHVGVRAPAPVLGQSVNDYRRETLRTLKRTMLPQNHNLAQVNCRGLPTDALGAIEPQMIRACVDAANDPSTVPPGEFRQIEERDETGSLRVIRFVGPESFVKQMGRPGRRVVSFNTHQGRFDASGRAMR
jgi:hypothetical protein